MIETSLTPIPTSKDDVIEMPSITESMTDTEIEAALGYKAVKYWMHAYVNDKGEACGYAVERVVVGSPDVAAYAYEWLGESGHTYIHKCSYEEEKKLGFATFGRYNQAFTSRNRWGREEETLFCCYPIEISRAKFPKVLTAKDWEGTRE